MDKGATTVYGKGLTLDHSIQQFDAQSQKIIALLKEEAGHYRAFKNSYYRYAYANDFSDSQIILVGEAFDKLFDLLSGQYVGFGRNESVHFCTEDPKVRLAVKAKEKGAQLQISITPEVVFFGEGRYLYALSGDALMRCSAEFREKVYPLLAQNQKVMTFSQQDLPTFCGCVLPELQDNVELDDPDGITAAYTPEEAHLLDLMLILHAEHSSNNSTFVCRAMSSSGTDTYSAIAGAVGSLKGPLHGGANAKVMQMFRDIRAHVGTAPTDDALGAYLDQILDGEAGDRSGKIYGLGHAVYTMSDPRAVVIKKYAAALARDKGRAGDLELMERVEELGIRKIMTRKHQSIPMCANVDLYSGLIYSMLDIPEDMYTPLFATARIAGWCAHRLEELATGNRIMRPAYRAMLMKVPYIPVEARE